MNERTNTCHYICDNDQIIVYIPYLPSSHAARITDLAPDNQQQRLLLIQYGKAVFLPIPSDVAELVGLKDGDRLELEVIDSNQLLVVQRK
jgi:hypothetical protein